ncbi:MAG: hypothetical protein GFH27_549313n118 [Chloroflexi bacterium AL-W]|nr:hypothetical protein [Chloroflexi bacterium AL-N1]NOK69541.1 hypothetical protein [Chloroflexi bacterium AL-N10]NOK77506.1 hypothetical protein [Chloroflexi bacterium AL-N5]NOK84357.1 hypothetical protein [Chloroflexi bacterium AL-W]NOK91477.1 hypothetical protein [Chloroflexi bacterium AL-N15]
MKLNHLNLTVTHVLEAHQFLEKSFGLQSMGVGADKMAGRLIHDLFASDVDGYPYKNDDLCELPAHSKHAEPISERAVIDKRRVY